MEGPDAFDCWGLTRHCQREVFGRAMPALTAADAADRDDIRAVMRAIKEHPLHALWTRAGAPHHGGIVTMAHHRYPSHIGVFLKLDRGGVLHCLKEDGVRFDAIMQLRMQGWSHFV